jgi:hypothetical protein
MENRRRYTRCHEVKPTRAGTGPRRPFVCAACRPRSGMRVTACLIAATLVGCVTTQPQSIGRDTYLIETMGTNMTVRPALDKATGFCAQQGKKVKLLTTNKGGVLVGANTSITFMCLDPTDPRYQDTAPTSP